MRSGGSAGDGGFFDWMFEAEGVGVDEEEGGGGGRLEDEGERVLCDSKSANMRSLSGITSLLSLLLMVLTTLSVSIFVLCSPSEVAVDESSRSACSEDRV